MNFRIVNFFKIYNRHVNWILASSLVLGTASGLAYCSSSSDNGLPLIEEPHIKFYQDGKLHFYDYKSVRRGFQVFREVCATCHSLKTFSFRHLINATHTEEDAKALAAEYEIDDEPNDEGEVLKRPGKIDDYWPNPYKNNEEAQYKNNGSLPPDLSWYVLWNHSLESHVFNLLNGYHETPPSGFKLEDGSYFNLYFPGNIISMPPPLVNEMVEYEDGTPATVSQMSKDVSTFLRWVMDPKLEERKRVGLKSIVIGLLILPFTFFANRFSHNLLRYRKIAFDKINWK